MDTDIDQILNTEIQIWNGSQIFQMDEIQI